MLRSAARSRSNSRIHLGFAEFYLGEPIWGHADVVIRQHPFLVIDYKNGFHPVPANATQLGLYLLMVALGADTDLGGGSTAHAGTTMVVQPNARGEPVRSHDWTWQDLRSLRDRVITTLRRVKRQDWTYQDGDWCRWCPAAGFCPHLAAVARNSALALIAPTPELVATGEISAETLADWLDVVDRLDVWAKKVQDVALDYVVHGGVLRNRKTVRKRTTRRFANEDEAAEVLSALGVDAYQRKLISPAEAERRLPKVQHPQLENLIEKPLGELTLAAADDPREAINVSATLQASLRSSVAAGYLQAAQTRANAMRERGASDE